MSLTQGCYGNQFTGGRGRFGLRCGQMRHMKGLVGNAGWYNRAGEKLGFGDLDVADFRRIANELQDDEIFVVLAEVDSFWNFVTNVGSLGSLCQTSPTEQAPGAEYCTMYARYVCTPGNVYVVGEGTSFARDGVDFQYMSRETLGDLMGAKPTEPTTFRERLRSLFK